MSSFEPLVPSESGNDEAVCCSLPCCDHDGNDEETNVASSDARVVSVLSTATQQSFDTSMNSGPSQRTLSPRGLYRPRSGRSAKVRFVLTIESRLSGDFDPVSESSENNQISSTSQCNPLSCILPKDSPVSETTTMKPILRLDNVPVSDEQTDEIWMNVDQEELEANDENNGMVVVIAPRCVELQEGCRGKRKGKYNYLDEKESSDISESETTSNIRDIPTDVTVCITPSMDEISQISRIYDEPEMDASRMSNKSKRSSRQTDPHVSVLKRLLRRMRGQRGAYKIVVRHGKEQFLV